MPEIHFPPAVWLVTFLVHSTVLLGLAWLIDRFRLLRSPAAREHLWRAALFGAVVTASVQSAGLVERVRLGDVLGGARPAAVRASEPAAPAVLAAPAASDAIAQPPTARAPLAGETLARTLAPPAAPPAATAPAPRSSGAFAARWPDALALLWLAGAGVAALRFLVLAWGARRELADRAPVGGVLAAELAALCSAARLRPPGLTMAPGLSGPISLPNREIVLPPWAVDALDPRRRRALLAHELAHHARRDPLWLVGTLALDALLWVQPLIGVARRRLADLAELSADAWAARAVGDPRALAECLAECAEHVHRGRAARFGAALSAESPLVERIDRLLKGIPMQLHQIPASLRIGALATLVAAAFLLPGCSPRDLFAHGHRVSTRISISDDGGSSVRIERPGYQLEMQCDGAVTFAPDESDVATLAAGCDFELTEEVEGVERGYVVRADGSGALARSFSRGAEAAPDDAEARQWLAAALPRMFRESGFDAEARVGRLLDRGGPELVLAEIDLTRGDHAKADYLGMLLAKRELDAAQLELALATVGRIESDYELRRALDATWASQRIDAPRCVRMLEIAGGMGSDHEKAEFLGAVAERLPADPEVRAAWTKAVARIDGDYDLRRTLEAGVEASRADDAFLAALIALAAQQIDSDFDLRTVLVAVAARASDPALAAAYLAAARKLHSDFERRTALIALLEEAQLDAAAKSGVLEATATLGSDFEKRTVLQALAPAVAADPALNHRYREVARSMSDFERGAALKSLDDAMR